MGTIKLSGSGTYDLVLTNDHHIKPSDNVDLPRMDNLQNMDMPDLFMPDLSAFHMPNIEMPNLGNAGGAVGLQPPFVPDIQMPIIEKPDIEMPKIEAPKPNTVKVNVNANGTAMTAEKGSADLPPGMEFVMDKPPVNPDLEPPPVDMDLMRPPDFPRRYELPDQRELDNLFSPPDVDVSSVDQTDDGTPEVSQKRDQDVHQEDNEQEQDVDGPEIPGHHGVAPGAPNASSDHEKKGDEQHETEKDPRGHKKQATGSHKKDPRNNRNHVNAHHDRRHPDVHTRQRNQGSQRPKKIVVRPQQKNSKVRPSPTEKEPRKPSLKPANNTSPWHPTTTGGKMKNLPEKINNYPSTECPTSGTAANCGNSQGSPANFIMGLLAGVSILFIMVIILGLYLRKRFKDAKRKAYRGSETPEPPPKDPHQAITRHVPAEPNIYSLPAGLVSPSPRGPTPAVGDPYTYHYPGIDDILPVKTLRHGGLPRSVISPQPRTRRFDSINSIKGGVMSVRGSGEMTHVNETLVARM